MKLSRRSLFKLGAGVAGNALTTPPVMLASAAGTPVVAATAAILTAGADIFVYDSGVNQFFSASDDHMGGLAELFEEAKKGISSVDYDIFIRRAIERIVSLHYIGLFDDSTIEHQHAYIKSSEFLKNYEMLVYHDEQDIINPGTLVQNEEDQELLDALQSRDSLNAYIKKLYEQVIELTSEFEKKTPDRSLMNVSDIRVYLSEHGVPKCYLANHENSKNTVEQIHWQIESEFFNKYQSFLKAYRLDPEIEKFVTNVEKSKYCRFLQFRNVFANDGIGYPNYAAFSPQELTFWEEHRLEIHEQVSLLGGETHSSGLGTDIFDHEFLGNEAKPRSWRKEKAKSETRTYITPWIMARPEFRFSVGAGDFPICSFSLDPEHGKLPEAQARIIAAVLKREFGLVTLQSFDRGTGTMHQDVFPFADHASRIVSWAKANEEARSPKLKV